MLDWEVVHRGDPAGVRARYLAGVMADDGYADQVRARVGTGRLLGGSAKEALEAARSGGCAGSESAARRPG
ncbi:hypothetical protein ACL02T_30835 [Pseudonocardia sp. RS010]|uniref:hypothetical protein n=1 Tax=Pseudonocardia sp. RS010 TaxID=3385979 RepID=UPI00399F94BE